MKSQRSLLIVVFLCLSNLVLAQPYSLDENIKPVLLELKDNPEGKGAKGILANATIKNENHYYFVKGHDMFQFIDVFIFSNFRNPNFKVNLVGATWKNIEDTQTTAASEKGVIHFKLRSQGDFGIEIFPSNETVNYSIVINASEPSQEFLGSAFKKITKKDMSDSEEFIPEDGNTNSEGSSPNYILYAIIGIALLVIGFLLSKMMNKNKANTMLWLISLGIFQSINAQEPPPIKTFDMNDILIDKYIDWLKEYGDDVLGEGSKSFDEFERRLDRLKFVGEKIRELNPYKKLKEIKELYDAYKGISSCIDAVRPPGMPKIPSFCETDDCETCFLGARAEFEDVRYKFVKLQAIYRCTMNYTDRAIAFGDSYSPVHGVSGLAWQSKKFEVLESVKSLKKSYDKKYQELLGRMQRALIELDACEAQHGIPDWYDRFGYIYYDFTKTQYHRND